MTKKIKGSEYEEIKVILKEELEKQINFSEDAKEILGDEDSYTY